jgi:prepilin-type processing-associated H-X9-DG protein
MFQCGHPERSGIGRFEVALIVLGVVTGVGLVILWAFGARTLDNRVGCVNNLKQLGIAMHNYHDVNNAFPNESGSNPSFYRGLLSFVEQSSVDAAMQQGMQGASNAPIKLYLCPTRRNIAAALGKCDYGYAASTGTGSIGTSVLDAPEPVTLSQITLKSANGATQTLLLSHLWMSPKHYSGGDPTDLGWATKNHARSVNNTAKQDSDSSGSTAHLGSIHPNTMPCLFADGHVQSVPYNWPHWNKAWASDNKQPFPLP